MKIVRLYILALVAFLLSSNILKAQDVTDETLKFGRALSLIDNYYVDTANINKLTEDVITYLLKELDPHSTYISADEVKEMNENLMGNFEGVGIQFNVLHDTIVVVEPISGGPSERVGLRSGDRIIKIDSVDVAGINITTTKVRQYLMGPKGTKVVVNVVRPGEGGVLVFVITRDKIPINSLDAAYMINDKVGYVRFNKFAATTEEEFSNAIANLKSEGMTDIIIDLRNNGGGVMTAATDMASHFFKDNKLLLYIEGRNVLRQNFLSTGKGNLSSARLVVIVDEGSASASEIMAGAIQDLDRGVVIGRRSFGKGLVQNQFYLTDGSMVRLTVARYYTPSGRLIQSSYDGGYDSYIENYEKRFIDGEMMSANNITFPDSLKFTTVVNKRTVYGGGGIMPDVFVGVDTSYYSMYYRHVVRLGILNSFALEYSDANRNKIKAAYPTFDEFKRKFEFSESDINSFVEQSKELGAVYEETQFDTSKGEILLILKGLVANTLWATNEYFEIINESDDVLERAIDIIMDGDEYDKILGY